MIDLWRHQKYTLLLSFIGLFAYSYFGVKIERTAFLTLVSLWFVLFLVSYQLIKLHPNNFWFLGGLALLYRLVLIQSMPNLSQDFYRFIWDGRMLLSGNNPYLSLPADFVTTESYPIAEAKQLISGMGSLNASHYTNYPPISQFIYTFATWTSRGSTIGAIISIRIVMLFADLGILYFGRKILLKIGLHENRIFWYLLNPFIIIELFGNLHFEGIMLFFIAWSLHLLLRKKWAFSAIVLGFAVATKLIPLLFLPFYLQWFINQNPKNKKQGFLIYSAFCLITIGSAVLLFLPFLSNALISNFASSIGLWFQNFEFNASIYYIVRWIGYQTVGWNIIETAGKILPMLTIGIVSTIALIRDNKKFADLTSAILIGMAIHYSLSTTVHPWYIAVPLLLSIFTNYRFVLAWSLTVIFSYAAYKNPQYKEDLALVALEYLVVFGVFIGDVIKIKTRKQTDRLLHHP